ncbi:MAG: hypothetical protein JW844_07845 [Candidatus Omnitrophica bacterium]|nr:hypothetical protein [Candidatus Omnitrophota bacterium]
MAKSKEVQCPVCRGSFDLEDECDWFEGGVGEVVYCPECDVKLEIVSLDPPEVKLAPRKKDDEYYEDESDDEDEDDEFNEDIADEDDLDEDDWEEEK